jgi:hypothetical protein
MRLAALTSALSFSNGPIPYNNPPLFVIPERSEGSAVRPSVARVFKGVTESVPRPPRQPCFSFSPAHLWDNEATLALEIGGLTWRFFAGGKHRKDPR